MQARTQSGAGCTLKAGEHAHLMHAIHAQRVLSARVSHHTRLRTCAKERAAGRVRMCAHYTDSACMHTRTLPVSCGQAEKRGRTKMKHRDIARAPVLCAL